MSRPPLGLGTGTRFLNRDRLPAKVLGGWQSSGIQFLQTTSPLTETVDCSLSSLLDGNSNSGYRRRSLHTPVELLTAVGGYIR